MDVQLGLNLPSPLSAFVCFLRNLLPPPPSAAVINGWPLTKRNQVNKLIQHARKKDATVLPFCAYSNDYEGNDENIIGKFLPLPYAFLQLPLSHPGRKDGTELMPLMGAELTAATAATGSGPKFD